jgi:phosphohistidine phosphatase
MALYLVRHGESVPKEINHNCPLSDRGLVEVAYVAARAAEKNVKVSHILHSGKKRALQTAIIFKDYIKPTMGIAASAGLNPNDDISLAVSITEKTDDLMFVGHLPFLEKLVSHLVNGNQDKGAVNIPTSGFICLEKNAKGKWEIKWKLFP